MSAAAARELRISRTTRDLISAGKITGCVALSLHESGSMRTVDEHDKRAIMAEYSVAYEGANPGKRAEIRDHGRGWYSIETNEGSGRQKHRIRKLAEMVLRLVERTHGGSS